MCQCNRAPKGKGPLTIIADPNHSWICCACEARTAVLVEDGHHYCQTCVNVHQARPCRAEVADARIPGRRILGRLMMGTGLGFLLSWASGTDHEPAPAYEHLIWIVLLILWGRWIETRGGTIK